MTTETVEQELKEHFIKKEEEFKKSLIDLPPFVFETAQEILKILSKRCNNSNKAKIIIDIVTRFL
jgi:hypothetical protein